jgi:hypothetical protein
MLGWRRITPNPPNNMALIQRRERDAHWYRKDGSPCHTMIGKSTGRERPTTVKDARELNLIPSVTNILSMKAKPALDVWKLDKAIMAAMKMERKGNETDEDFATRIAEASEDEARKAAEWGTLLHEQVEHYNIHGSFSGTGEILDYVKWYEPWFKENIVKVISAEKTIVGNGYAGRMDLYAIIRHDGKDRRAVIDLKSQKFGNRKKANFYPEWSMQLAAYANPLTEPEELPPLLVSLVMQSDTPGPVIPHVWDNTDAAFKAFRACQELWAFDKNYDPRS